MHEADGLTGVEKLKLDQVLELSRQRHDHRLEILQTEGAPLDAPAHSMLASRLTNRSYVSQIVPSDLSCQDYLTATTEEDEADAEARLQLCMTACPETHRPNAVGACRSLEHEGRGPVWGDGFEWKRCQRWAIYQLDQKLVAGGYPKKLIPKGFGGFDAVTEALTKALGVCVDYLDDYPSLDPGKGLLLSGDWGVGKTHLIVAVAREMHARRYVKTSRFWDTELLLFKLRQYDEESTQVMTEALATDLLVLDDFNMAKATDWASQQMSIVLNQRWGNQQPTLFTTNNTLESQAEKLGERTVSRLVDSTMGQQILGEDWRMRIPEAQQ